MRKRKKKGEQKSQKCDISPLCGGAPCKLIATTFGVFVGLTNVITYAKNSFKIASGFSRATGGKTHVSLQKANGLYNIAMRYRACLWWDCSDSKTRLYNSMSYWDLKLKPRFGGHVVSESQITVKPVFPVIVCWIQIKQSCSKWYMRYHLLDNHWSSTTLKQRNLCLKVTRR